MLAAIGWAALLPLATFAASRPQSTAGSFGLAFLVYGLGSVICHQLPTRSFQLWATQLPICARCTGIYAGGAIAALVEIGGVTGLTSRRDTHPTPVRARAVLFVAALPRVATLVFEWTTGQPPSNVLRALAGVPLGATCVWLVR